MSQMESHLHPPAPSISGSDSSQTQSHCQFHDSSTDMGSGVNRSNTSAFISRIRRKPVPGRTPAPTELAQLKNEKRHATARISKVGNQGENQQGDSKISPRRGLSSSLGLWKWELMSLFVSAASFVGIIILLRFYQDETLSSWKALLSINAIVAILSAAFKGSLGLPITEGISQLKWLWYSGKPRSLADIDMYDKASRGPWGSFLFVTGLFVRRQRSYLASLGALLAIITLATDPFSQATVSLKSCLKPVSEEASIPIANRYSAVGAHYAVNSNTLDTAMQFAMYRGLLNPAKNSSASISALCPSGNCTFPADQGATFTNLSMCHSCRDISDTVRSLEASAAYELPNGPTVQTASILNTTAVKRALDLSYPLGSWQSTNLLDIQGIAKVKVDHNCPERDVCEMVPLAFECALRPCVKTYGANYTRGVYHEEELLLSRDYLHYVPGAVRKWQLAMNRTMYNGTWKDCKASPTRTETHTEQVALPEIQQQTVYTVTYPSVWYPPECVFGITGVSMNAMADFLLDLFSGTTVQFASFQWALNGPFWFQNLYKAGKMDLATVDEWADGLTLVIGAQMRANSDGPEILCKVRGQSLRQETCIRVQWKFLSFLAVLISLEVFFVLAVIILNHRNSWNGDWKSSSLALIFQNLGPPEPPQMGDLVAGSEQALTAAAKPMNVFFSQVEGRWQLTKEGGT